MCLSVYVPVFVFGFCLIRVCVCLCVLCVRLSVHFCLSVCLSVCLSFCLYVSAFVCLSMHRGVCISVYLCIPQLPSVYISTATGLVLNSRHPPTFLPLIPQHDYTGDGKLRFWDSKFTRLLREIISHKLIKDASQHKLVQDALLQSSR